jgi:hypothetical protein
MRWPLLFVALPALACEYPDEGTMPLRRAVSQVKALPEVEAWAKAMHDQGEVVQYAVKLDEYSLQNRRCFWTVEVNAAGRTWRRFQVTPDGRHLRRETADPRRREGR